MIAVFYDVENLRVKDNYQKAILKVKELYKEKHLIQFAYAEWSRFSDSNRKIFIENGIILKQVINGIGYTQNIKDIADIALSVDAIDLVHKNPNITNFIIVSGDGGYVSLATKLREYGKIVDIVSLPENISKILVKYVDNVHIIKEVQDKKVNTPVQQTSYKKAIWAIFKSYDNFLDIPKHLFKNLSILNQLENNGIYFPSLVKTYANAINKPVKSEEVADFVTHCKNYINNNPKLKLGKNYLYYSKKFDRENLIKLFKEVKIELSSTNISALLIEEVLKNKEMYLSLTKTNFIKLLKENTKRSIKLITGVSNVFYLLEHDAVSLDKDNYKDKLSGKLSIYLSNKTSYPITKEDIKNLFGWSILTQ